MLRLEIIVQFVDIVEILDHHSVEIKYNNSYMIYIIRNPILWLGISAYGGGVLSVYFFDRRCSADYFFVM
jgi:hypothetical protein